MFNLILWGLSSAGVFCLMLDLIFYYSGIPLLIGVNIGIKICGIILVFLGIGLFYSRTVSTGAIHFTPLANPNHTILFHQGKSNTRIIRGKKEEPNRIRARGKGRGAYMNIRDMGNNMNVGGHDVAISTQDDGHTLPLWLCDTISKYKRRYGATNEKEFNELYDKIKNISSYNDLANIEFLKPIYNNPEKRSMLLDISLDDLRNMRELLFDGRTIDAKSYIGWSEDATPYDNETIIDSTVAHFRAQDMSLRNLGGIDFVKYILPICILFIMGAIAYQIFGG